jgi:hypothetical protein
MGLIAIGAVGFALFRPLSESRAVRIAREQVRRNRPDINLSRCDVGYTLTQHKGRSFAVVSFIERGRTTGAGVLFWDNSPRDPEIVTTER